MLWHSLSLIFRAKSVTEGIFSFKPTAAPSMVSIYLQDEIKIEKIHFDLSSSYCLPPFELIIVILF